MHLTGDGAGRLSASRWNEGEYDTESGSIAESFRDDVKEPEWLLSSEPAREDRNRSLTLLKCPAFPPSCQSSSLGIRDRYAT